MSRVLLIHWHEGEWGDRVQRLRRLGLEVDPLCFTILDGPSMKLLTLDPPDAFVIDLERLPSHGKAVAMALRQAKATRSVPLVFVEGQPEKVAVVRAMLPDAVYTTWKSIKPAIRRAISAAPASPVVPQSTSGYSGTPLPKKLGIKPGSRVVLLGAPRGFSATLGELPMGARTKILHSCPGDVVLFFVKSEAVLCTKLGAAQKVTAVRGRLWILWPKKASGVPTDVTEAIVRQAGLRAGWVDYKVAAIDAVWSGLCFARRRI